MRVINLRNLAPLVKVGAWVAVLAILLNAALYALSATPALSWLPDRQTGVGFTLDNRQRLEGAEQQYRDGTVRADKRLGAIVGISNIREAVDLDVLNEELGKNWRFLGIAGAGAGAASIVDNAKILEQSRLRPDLVVVGAAPLETLDILLPGAYKPADPTIREKLKGEAKQLVWLNSRRRDVSVSTERGLLDLRARLFAVADVDLPTADTRTPWRSMLRLMGSERYPDKVFRDGIVWAHSIGAFDMRSYVDSKTAPQMLATTLRKLSANGARIVVVLTPEHSLLRSREPLGIAEYLRARLADESGVPSLLLLDYRAAVPDDGFVDLVHLNLSGSKRFTPLLARDLGALTWPQPPLMSSSKAVASSTGPAEPQ